mmetsp:Transcript_28735/g.66707  ORF Transcript_28735/g.66707 Transcript_28735/m.66707 type:complete len:663 (-) Transcript_28735:130-2118(-)
MKALWALCILGATFGQELRSTDYILQRAQSLSGQGDGKLQRGYLSLALHLDPWILQDPQTQWVGRVLQGEQRTYWRGNMYVGHDKTYLESLFARAELFGDSRKSLLALVSWRNLQLTGLSCCGVDNLAVYFQQANKHLYVAPFVDLVPGYGERLKPDNIRMYKSFRQWWEETGRRPMPEPAVTHKGRGIFEWDLMKVVLRAARVPNGWGDFTQAYLLLKLERREDARAAVRIALKKNSELLPAIDDLMPALKGMPVPAPEAGATSPSLLDRKFVVNYNPHVGLGNLAVVMCSSYLLAKLLGRTFVLSWNVNTVVQHAFRLLDSSNTALVENAVEQGLGLVPKKVRNMYFFHMMDSFDLGDTLEVFGCSNMVKEFESYPVITVSSNMWYAPLLAINPHVGPEVAADFPNLLAQLFAPSEAAARRALSFAKESQWAKERPVIAVHIRAREEGEDNDDWPTASSPDRDILDNLLQCVEAAVRQNFGKDAKWDAFIASTTEQAQSAAAKALETKAKGLVRVLKLPSLLRNRRTEQGTVDAMAEALLISRADIFMRLVVGTSGFSTFAFFSNALRRQNSWLDSSTSHLHRDGFAPNYLVTSSCGPGRCYVAPPEVRMARISWHGDRFTHRSCGKVLEKVEASGVEELGCRGLRQVDHSNLIDLRGEL